MKIRGFEKKKKNLIDQIDENEVYERQDMPEGM